MRAKAAADTWFSIPKITSLAGLRGGRTLAVNVERIGDVANTVNNRRSWKRVLPGSLGFGSAMMAYYAVSELHDSGHPVWGVLAKGILAGILWGVFTYLTQ